MSILAFLLACQGYDLTPLDDHTRTIARLIDIGSTPRRAFRKIGRAQEPVLPVSKHQCLALVPYMVAGGHHIGASIQRFLKDRFGDPETTGRIFAIDDDKIEFPPVNQAGKLLVDRLPTALANHVSQKQQSHHHAFPPALKR